MITTGIIVGKKYDKNNTLIYLVDISLFKNPGITSDLNNTIFETTCCAAPGSYEPYKENDKVYIGFVNNKLQQPVILGKIYQNYDIENNETASSYQFIQSLKVTGNTQLSEDTIIGDITYKDLKTNFLLTNNLIAQDNEDTQDLIPERFSIAYNLVVNINNSQFDANIASWSEESTSLFPTYTTRQLLKNGTVVKDEEYISSYLSFMTGNPTIDKYNSTKPTPIFIYLNSTDTIWKLQYDSTNGLVAFKVRNFPLATKTELQSKQDKLKIFKNISASNWVNDFTYAGYSYKCELSCDGITNDSIVEVLFNLTEIESGNYAPICNTSTNSVTIYSKVNTVITIPVIKEI